MLLIKNYPEIQENGYRNIESESSFHIKKENMINWVDIVWPPFYFLHLQVSGLVIFFFSNKKSTPRKCSQQKSSGPNYETSVVTSVILRKINSYTP